MTAPTTPAVEVLARRDEAYKPTLKQIGDAIGYGNAQSILGQLWDAMLEADYGITAPSRGQMGVTVDDALPPVPNAGLRARAVRQSRAATRGPRGTSMTTSRGARAMAQSKATPGPWFVEGCTVYALHGDPLRNRFSAFVSSGRADDASADECRANALLMASAPDLLAALIELLAAGDECVSGDDDVAAMLRFGEAHEVAREVIARATGAESP